MKRICYGPLVLLSSALSIDAVQGQPEFQPLGVVPSEGATYATAVSADGRVVAGITQTQIFRWTVDGGMQLIGAPPPPYFGYPEVLDMSRDGTIIVGFALDIWRKLYPSGAYVWTLEGGFQTLGNYTDIPGSRAHAVADDDTVFAYLEPGAGPSGPGVYRWTREGGLDLIPGADYPLGVSGDGVFLVGGHYPGALAARWSVEHGTELLGEFPGGSNLGFGFAASRDGSVVVGGSSSGRTNPTYELEAFRWTQASGMVSIGVLPSEQPGSQVWSRPSGVSADGSIVVGTSAVRVAYPSAAAFIWRDDGRGMRKLQDVLIDDYGLAEQLAGWNLWGATDISPDGQYIVGAGIDPQGRSQAFRVRLPLPCPSDFNADGFTNSQDFFNYLTAFFTTPTCPQPCPNSDLHCPADFNRDCLINTADFFDFLAAFLAGCP